MINYINASAEIIDGTMKINLLKTYDYIGLVSVCFPRYIFSDSTPISVEIQVDEIDKTYENPHRVLSRLHFEYKVNNYFYQYETTHIQWQKLDSQTKPDWNQITTKFRDDAAEAALETEKVR